MLIDSLFVQCARMLKTLLATCSHNRDKNGDKLLRPVIEECLQQDRVTDAQAQMLSGLTNLQEMLDPADLTFITCNITTI